MKPDNKFFRSATELWSLAGELNAHLGQINFDQLSDRGQKELLEHSLSKAIVMQGRLDNIYKVLRKTVDRLKQEQCQHPPESRKEFGQGNVYCRKCGKVLDDAKG